MNEKLHNNINTIPNSMESQMDNGDLPSIFSSMAMATPPLFKHQQETKEFILKNPRVLCFSDAGTGKTRAVLEAIFERRMQAREPKRVLVLAPKSILEPAWGADIRKFTPKLKYSIAEAKNRKSAFDAPTDIVITNHDAVKWILEHVEVLENFDTLVIDESTVFKNPSSQRSKAIAALSKLFEYRIALTGTPAPNSILDVWNQVFIVDDGEHLGKSYYKFRSFACENTNSFGSFPKWQDKEGVRDTVSDALNEITIRHKLEDCLDIPENFTTEIEYELDAKNRQIYDDMVRHNIVDIDLSTVSAAQAGVLTMKLLQIAAGMVYDDEKGVITVSDDRTKLIVDLIDQRKQCVVSFLWRHQRDTIIKHLTKRKISYRVIDGSVNSRKRASAVNEFQNGEVRVILAHPQSAGHGLTLTNGTTTIWASPTYNSEFYEQFNRRIYRAGQKKKTETLHIMATDTIDTEVYKKLKTKQTNMHNLLNQIKENYEIIHST